MSTYNRKYYLKQKERSKIWNQANKDRVRANLSRSRKSNPVRHLLNLVRNRSKKKGLDFNLESSDIIIPIRCPYLNIEITVFGTIDQAPSIDRIDNSKGYVKGNVEVISTQANRMKNTATLTELKIFATNILKKIG